MSSTRRSSPSSTLAPRLREEESEKEDSQGDSSSEKAIVDARGTAGASRVAGSVEELLNEPKVLDWFAEALVLGEE